LKGLSNGFDNCIGPPTYAFTRQGGLALAPWCII